ncbi:histone-fold-containing protein [Mortierella sp. GBAus27b]|nr:hypothetical protein BGX31_007284 [Mortierella sp. GBA43]KAI8353842.1 histone-fold-containing protein [Mortierella sp. GBAus27b]
MSTSIEDNELPKAILTRIMKQALPDNTNIQANAKLAMAKSTTLFINYLASAANDVALGAGHKIVSGTHVLKALESLDMDDIVPRLTEELKAFQSIQKSRKEGAAKTKDKDDSSGTAGSKKRKPSEEGSKTAAKARKASAGANPRDGMDTPSESILGDDELEDDEGAGADDDEDENGKDGDDDDDDNNEAEEGEAGEADGIAQGPSLNMDEGEQEDEDDKASNLDDDDSDGF